MKNGRPEMFSWNAKSSVQTNALACKSEMQDLGLTDGILDVFKKYFHQKGK